MHPHLLRSIGRGQTDAYSDSGELGALLDSGGGLVAEVDHGIPPDISLDNYRYFRDLLWRLCEQ